MILLQTPKVKRWTNGYRVRCTAVFVPMANMDMLDLNPMINHYIRQTILSGDGISAKHTYINKLI